MDNSGTYKSMQRALMATIDGIHAGICNRFNHRNPAVIDEQVALEQLAARSLLAKWAVESTMERAS